MLGHPDLIIYERDPCRIICVHEGVCCVHVTGKTSPEDVLGLRSCWVSYVFGCVLVFYGRIKEVPILAGRLYIQYVQLCHLFGAIHLYIRI